MYQSHHHDDLGDEVGSRLHPGEDSVTSRGLKRKQSGWVFISRRTDIVIVLVLLLASGLGIMWFISRLPFYLETASAHYHWVKDMYVTWGTPSVRWLFINLVVLSIVAASGLLSAFGCGDQAGPSGGRVGSGRTVDRASSFKGHVYEGPHPPTYNAVGAVYHRGLPHPSYDAVSYNASSTRFSGPGYESPIYNPYLMPGKSGPASQSGGSHRRWEYRHYPEEEEEEEEEQGPRIPAIEVEEEMRGMVGESSPSYRTEEEEPSPPEEISREIALAGDAPEAPSVESSHHQQMILAQRTLPQEVPELDFVQTETGGDSEAVDSTSDVHDPMPEIDETDENERDDGRTHHLPHHQRTKTDSAIQFTSSEELRSGGSSPGRPQALPKSHTFTIGRVIRRDQLVEFMEPLSQKLEGIGRKIRLDPHFSRRGSHGVSHGAELPVQQSRELFVPPSPSSSISVPHSDFAFEDGRPQPHPERLHHRNETVMHRRRHSAEGVPGVTHHRRMSSESVGPRGEPAHLRALGPDLSGRMLGPDPSGRSSLETPKQHPAAPGPPPPPPLLKQRSIVYPPALLSQASPPADSVSSPSSPPIQEAIRPPPPPPHLKLPSALEGSDLPSTSSFTGEKSSAKSIDKPPASENKKSTKQIRSASSHDTSLTGRTSDRSQNVGSSIAQEDQSRKGTVKPPITDDSDAEDVKEGGLSAEDREDSMSVSNDVLHQQIEDFLARFHENMRLQRQESIARYRKRLEELDD